jgi:hypothetical protein
LLGIEDLNALVPSFRKMSIGWVISAKREETQLRMLDMLIELSKKERKRAAVDD